MSRKFVLSFLFALFVSFGAKAQNVVVGRVVDEVGEAVPYASVALRQDGKIVSGAITDNDASFQIKGAYKGEFLLTVSFVGYMDTSMELTFDGQKKIDIASASTIPTMSPSVATATSSSCSTGFPQQFLSYPFHRFVLGHQHR